jgi:ABC-type polysaccharide/polyol phosphate export permease
MTTNDYIIFTLTGLILLILIFSVLRDFMQNISQNKNLIKNMNNLQAKDDNKENNR